MVQMKGIEPRTNEDKTLIDKLYQVLRMYCRQYSNTGIITGVFFLIFIFTLCLWYQTAASYPGSQRADGYNEHFNRALRKEVLNAEWFQTTSQA